MPERIPTLIRGVLYPSQSDAARALGLATGTISNALDRGTIDNAGLGANFNRKHPVSANGADYPSIGSASRANGHCDRAVSVYIRNAKKKVRTSTVYRGVEYSWEIK